MNLKPPQKVADWRKEVQERPEPEWLLQEFLHRETIIMLSGPPKLSQKSWFALLMGASLSSGKSLAMFKPTEKLPIYFVEQEGAAHPLEQRFGALERGYDLGPDDWDQFYFAHMLPLFLHERTKVDELVAQVKDLGIKLVVLDTFAKVSGADENSVKEVGLSLRAFDKLRGVGASVMFLHHTTKALRVKSGDVNEDIDSDSRGSTALNGFVDAHIGLRRGSANQPYTMLTMRGKDFDDRRYAVKWDIGGDPLAATLEWEALDAGAMASGVVTACLYRLVPGRKYSLGALDALWGTQNRIETKAIVEILTDNGGLVKVGKTYELGNRETKDE